MSLENFTHWTYGQGHQLDTAAEIAAFARESNLEEAANRLAEQKVKDGLRVNTEEAIAGNLFGVPSFLVAGEVFWGDDATEMVRDFIKDRTLFNSGEMWRLSNMSKRSESGEHSICDGDRSEAARPRQLVVVGWKSWAS